MAILGRWDHSVGSCSGLHSNMLAALAEKKRVPFCGIGMEAM